MTLVTIREGENFTHKHLWQVVVRQMDNANARPGGSLYDDLAAMVFAFHAFEAYLNFLGLLLDPETWANERVFFGRPPYRGFDGKIRRIFELCEMQEPRRDGRPYRTIWTLKSLRDFIAHGKPDVFRNEYQEPETASASFFSGPFDKLVSHPQAVIAIQDIHELASLLHKVARSSIEKIRAECPDRFSDNVALMYFGDDPFIGLLGHATTSSMVTSD